MNVVSSKKLQALKRIAYASESIRMDMQDLQKAFPEKKRIVMLYQFPAM